MAKARTDVSGIRIEQQNWFVSFRVFVLSRFRDSARAMGVPVVLLLMERSGSAQHLDPTAWGGDRVGQAVPAFTSGDECLFCHRMDVGPGWAKNRHGQTVRIADGEFESLKALGELP